MEQAEAPSRDCGTSVTLIISCNPRLSLKIQCADEDHEMRLKSLVSEPLS